MGTSMNGIRDMGNDRKRTGRAVCDHRTLQQEAWFGSTALVGTRCPPCLGNVLRPVIASFLATMMFCASADVPKPNAITACDISFLLPSQYRVTKPKRSTNSAKLGECSFNIISVKPKKVAGECRDEDERGQKPYNVCDWEISGLDGYNSVVVASTDLSGKDKQIGDFNFEEGGWVLPNAYRQPDPAELIDFFGKKAYSANWTFRLHWYRTKVKKYQGEYAGAGDLEGVLVQLAPNLVVALLAAPLDDEKSTQPECVIFCSSLRSATSPSKK
jgi:hypothetical protein